MKFQVIIVCAHCKGYNKHQRGSEGFEERETDFESFSEASQHLIKNLDHWMDFEIRETKNE